MRFHYQHDLPSEVEITDEVILEGIDLAPTYSIEDYVDDIYDRVRELLLKEHQDSSCCSMDEICDLVMRYWHELLKGKAKEEVENGFARSARQSRVIVPSFLDSAIVKRHKE